MSRARRSIAASALALGLCAGVAQAAEQGKDKLEPLVPSVANGTYALSEGPRPYKNRLAISPAYGRLGAEPLFSLRAVYYPSASLGYEASFGHNPGRAVHAVLHSFNAIVRHPFPGRFQPYAKAGYGMLMVTPGPSLNADPVTKNALTVGGGLEVYIRNDVALRAESQLATVIGSERNREGTVAYNYPMYTIGLEFFRTIAP